MTTTENFQQTTSPLALKQIESHMAKWYGCNLCDRHVCCGAYVFYRGHVPAPVLFIGEAPGETENIIGRPFTGPAGDKLNEIIHRSGKFTFAITNVVVCAPFNHEADLRSPTYEEILHCRPRLQEFVKICNPKLLVGVGKYGEEACRVFPDVFSIAIRHPSWILRQDDKVLETERAVLEIKEGLKRVRLLQV